MNSIAPGLPILCADGITHGHTEGVEREYLVTTPLEDGRRHFIPLNLVGSVDQAVHLTVSHQDLLELL